MLYFSIANDLILFSTIEDLNKKIDYFNSFGNVEAMAKDLKCKTDECEALQKVSVALFSITQSISNVKFPHNYLIS